MKYLMPGNVRWMGALLAATGAAVALTAGTHPGPQSASSAKPVAPDTFVLEVVAPEGSQVTIDGRDYGTKRHFVYRPLKSAMHYQSQLQVRLDDRQENRPVDVVGGESLRLAVLTLPPVALPIGSQEAVEEPQCSADALRANPANDFALELLGRLTNSNDNLVISPYSLHSALSMAAAGAAGNTQLQMAAVLRTPTSDYERDSWNTLRRQLAALHDAAGDESAAFQWSSNQAVWVQEGFELHESFVSAMRNAHDANMYQVDFAGDTDGARRQINDWVASATRDQIRTLVDENSPAANTRLFLASAVNFSGLWKVAFDPQDTTDELFQPAASERVKVPTMKLNARLRWTRYANFQLLELPYAGEELSMLVLIPDPNSAPVLSAVELARAVQSLRIREVELALPRFEVDVRLSLAETFAGLGMADAFGSRADFSGISKDSELMISQVLQRARIRVDERGTEAAAATGVSVVPKSVTPGETVHFQADRPFVFLIQHQASGTILFAGRVCNPSVQESTN